MRRSLLVGVSVGAFASVALGVPGGVGSPRASAISASPAALLVIESGSPPARVSIVTLAGKKLPVPPRVRASPGGLSPDERLVARVRDGSASSAVETLELASIRGGTAKTLLSATAITFAWSPDSRRLAATATSPKGAPTLRLFDRAGRQLTSIALPADRYPDGTVTHNYYLIAWAPDGSRLLATQDAGGSGYYPHAIVTFDLRTKQLRTLAENAPKDDPTTVAWSPDSRFVALAGGEGFSMRDYVFAVIDTERSKPVIYCTAGFAPQGTPVGTPSCPTKFGGSGAPTALAWAPDSRSVFVRSFGVIERLDLTGGRSTVTRAGSGYLLCAVGSKLLYGNALVSSAPVRPATLQLLDLRTKTRHAIFQSRTADIATVIPLARVP
jgi:WD40 repeat protein